MGNSTNFIKRKLANGLGQAVAKRTILRKKNKNEIESWDDVAKRVALGNVSLVGLDEKSNEYKDLYKHITNASILMSGRHLQHGDKTQKNRTQEVFTNCSVTAFSFVKFYLLLNGSGVGRSYDDDMMIVDWSYMPNVVCVLSKKHPDYVDTLKTPDMPSKSKNTTLISVEDSREGWAKALETLEIMTFEKKWKNHTLILDFSKVRENGAPIGGMQGRPASGPVPLMEAIENIYSIKDKNFKPWKQAMYIDHYLAECVLVGGVRRSARIATKFWSDPDINEFIKIKQNGGLWSANNSIAVDSSFWRQDTPQKRDIFEKALRAGYDHNSGEPGFINVDKLVANNEGLEEKKDGGFIGNSKMRPEPETKKLFEEALKRVAKKKYKYIVNPCSEIVISTLSGFCVIADVAPLFAPTLDDAEEAFRLTTRALIRVNLMSSIFDFEVKRTNRIGVGITGVHEFAWEKFGYGFRDLIDEKKSQDFWNTIARFKRAVRDEAEKYSRELGVTVPHTNTTVKPSGSVSKLFALTEGVHLPAMREYLRWVQFRNDDPLVKTYRDLGYPTRSLKTYKGSTIVGFPTQPTICKLKMAEKLVTAGEATPEEQYKWLMLLEKYYIVGVDEEGNALNDSGNQLSYTLKIIKERVGYQDYKKIVREYQSRIKCCSVMPQTENVVYEYQPEEPISTDKFINLVENIKDKEYLQDIDINELKCANGACPI